MKTAAHGSQPVVPAANSLRGMRVLLTRPAPQAEGIAELIRAGGGEVLPLPLLEIEPLTERAAVERLKSRVLNLDHYDIAIFISTNAATLGLQWIENYWPQLPVGLEACAVGPGTAEALRHLPWPVHCSERGVTSEDLLALPCLTDVQDKRIALFRGQGGRELLAETLRGRGARVDYFELYRRQVPRYSRDEVLGRIAQASVNCAVITSLQSLDSFLDLLGGAAVAVDDSEPAASERPGIEQPGIEQAEFEKTSIDRTSIEQKAGPQTFSTQTGGKPADSAQPDSRDTDKSALLSLLRNLWLIVPSDRIRTKALQAGFLKVINAGGADDRSVLISLQACQAQTALQREVE